LVGFTKEWFPIFDTLVIKPNPLPIKEGVIYIVSREICWLFPERSDLFFPWKLKTNTLWQTCCTWIMQNPAFSMKIIDFNS
jgi:hypothetical protein